MSETTTSETVTETPKKKKLSILTDAAYRAKAKMTSDNSTESETTPAKFNIKKFAAGVGIATAGVVAVYGAFKLIADRMAEVDADSSEDNDTDSETDLDD